METEIFLVDPAKREDIRKLNEISTSLIERRLELRKCIPGTLEGDMATRRLKQQIRCLLEKCGLDEILSKNPEYVTLWDKLTAEQVN